MGDGLAPRAIWSGGNRSPYLQEDYAGHRGAAFFSGVGGTAGLGDFKAIDEIDELGPAANSSAIHVQVLAKAHDPLPIPQAALLCVPRSTQRFAK